MAIEQPAFDILKSLSPCRALFLGMPDLLLNEQFDVREADDWQAIAKWHNWDGPIYDTEAVFREFGIDACIAPIVAAGPARSTTRRSACVTQSAASAARTALTPVTGRSYARAALSTTAASATRGVGRGPART